MADWKSHPVVIAAIAAASTAVFFISVVTPIITAHDSNQIKNLKELIEAQNKKSKKIQDTHKTETAELKSTISEQIKTIESLTIEVEKYKNEDRFSKDNPFPKGLRSIPLFSEYKKISTVYPKEDFNEDTYYTPIDIKDSLFKSAIYYPTKCNNLKIIREARFTYRSALDDYIDAIDKNKKDTEYSIPSLPDDDEIKQSKADKKNALLAIFKELYGQPIETDDKEDHIFIVSESTAAFINDVGLYIISRYNDDEIKETCSKQLACPIPQSKQDG